MRVELKEYKELKRSMYVIYPAGDRLSCYENTMITVLRENDTREDIDRLCADREFEKLVDDQRFVMLFPNPVDGKWNYNLEESGRDDLSDIIKMIDIFNYQPDIIDRGIYHNMHNARYFMGVGFGASMLHTLAACHPVNVAGIFTINGTLSDRAVQESKNAAVPAILWNTDEKTVSFFRELNRAETIKEGYACNKVNDSARVYWETGKSDAITPEAVRYAWENLFSKVCRPNSSVFGTPGPRMVKDDYKFDIHENEALPGDDKVTEHTWFEYLPESVKQYPDRKVPLFIFNHGGGDTPGNICNTIKLHEVAEKEGFILVYPWSSAKWGWNQDMAEDQPDDVAYLQALISYMKQKYAIDETRIYMGGFSNGSAMAQVFAMVHPELIAAVFANNTRFCQNRNTRPFAIAGKIKLEKDYRMPVWYIYGTRDVEYPAVRGSGQQVQYDFWKSYNNITCKETPYINEPAACGAGVAGDKIEVIYPNPRYPQRKYTVHRFYSDDVEPRNFYNYTIADGKGHDCNPEEAWLGWNYVKQFRRLADGSTVMDTSTNS